MVKNKVSKNSRAARRGYDEQSHESKELSKVPKNDSYEDNVKKSIIRSNIINENLLAKKMDKRKITKRKTNTIKQKSNRFNTTSGILSTKIDHSVSRHNFIKSTRKSGWDKINQDINVKELENEKNKEEAAKDNEQMDEDDQLLQEYFQETKQGSGQTPKQEAPQNKFSLLEEAEA